MKQNRKQIKVKKNNKQSKAKPTRSKPNINQEFRIFSELKTKKRRIPG